MIDGDETAQGFSLVEHPMSAARARGAVAPAYPRGRVQLRPRGPDGRAARRRASSRPAPATSCSSRADQWHTFWNAGDEPCRILEIISPAGFEHYFEELVDLGGPANVTPDVLGELTMRYGLEMDPASIPELIQRFGVVVSGAPAQ